MANEVAIHNEICRRFKKEDYSKKFIAEHTQEGCKKIHKITLEDIISSNNILIGFCDVVIDYEDEIGNAQALLIEVKSSADVINKDSNDVLRQIKKYIFYLKKITKVFLIYSGDHLIEDTDLFTDENITLLNIDHWGSMVTERYDNGMKKTECTYKDGKLNRILTEWYENGDKKTECTYKDGNLDGIFRSWYENGNKKSERTYKDGKLDSIVTEWYENGDKKAECTYKDGNLDGISMSWYENGKKKSECTYKDGKKLVEIVTEWYENGKKKSECTIPGGMEN